jgi:ABC-type proline/glycine betaine transport system permease subunit
MVCWIVGNEFEGNANRVIRFIQDNPGCHLRQIKKELKLSLGMVQYHLDRLEKNPIILLALSISAYRKSGLKKIAYAAIAFALFAIQLFFGILEDTVKSLETVYVNIISYAMTLTILILFLLAIVKRK